MKWAALLAIAGLLGAPAGLGAQTATPLVIPVVVPLTGGFSYAGQIGKKTIEAFEAQVNKGGGVHGRPVKFVRWEVAKQHWAAVSKLGGLPL